MITRKRSMALAYRRIAADAHMVETSSIAEQYPDLTPDEVEQVAHDLGTIARALGARAARLGG